MGKIILDLCGGTGSWSKPYVDAGYDVRLITLPEADVRLYMPPENVHGILAAPPCTHFAVSGARWWKQKGTSAILDGLSAVDACLRVILISNPSWWCLENPVGRLKDYIGPYKHIFQPYEYGDPWTKRTCLWGNFTLPEKTPVDPKGQWIGGNNKNGIDLGIVDHFSEYLSPDRVHKLPPSKDRATLRSLTPPGFARAFFAANP